MKDLLTHPKPFSLPEYSRAFERFIRESVKHLMDAKDQLWAMMPKSEPIPAIPIMQNTMPSGQIVQNNPFVISAAFEFRLRDYRSCNDGSRSSKPYWIAARSPTHPEFEGARP